LRVLEIDEAVRTDDRVRAIVWEERWLNESAIANFTNDLAQKLQSSFEDLIVSDRFGIQIVVVGCCASAAVSGFQKLGGVRVISGCLYEQLGETKNLSFFSYSMPEIMRSYSSHSGA